MYLTAAQIEQLAEFSEGEDMTIEPSYARSEVDHDVSFPIDIVRQAMTFPSWRIAPDGTVLTLSD